MAQVNCSCGESVDFPHVLKHSCIAPRDGEGYHLPQVWTIRRMNARPTRRKDMLREDLTTALKEAMKAKDTRKLSTIRLVQAAIKDRDIANRGEGKGELSDEDVLQLMAKLVKQREESAKIYEDNARPELAAQEREEVAIIKTFMPEQMSDEKVREAIAAVITEINAEGMRDMGKVVAALKERYAGQMDFAKASGVVKALLTK
jgi:uncharacterized protein YqeY